MVYVQDIDGKPLMPTTRHGKVGDCSNQTKQSL